MADLSTDSSQVPVDIREKLSELDLELQEGKNRIFALTSTDFRRTIFVMIFTMSVF